MLAEIDRRAQSITTLNSSLIVTYAQIDDNMATQRASIESDQYIESCGVIRSFVRNVMHYASADDKAPRSPLIDKGTI